MSIKERTKEEWAVIVAKRRATMEMNQQKRQRLDELRRTDPYFRNRHISVDDERQTQEVREIVDKKKVAGAPPAAVSNLERNPFRPGEKYVSPVNGGYIPLSRSIKMAKAIARRFGIEKEDPEMEVFLLELARFCEAESGLPQVVEDLTSCLPDQPMKGGIEFPLAFGGRLLVHVTKITRDQIPRVLSIVSLILENASEGGDCADA